MRVFYDDLNRLCWWIGSAAVGTFIIVQYNIYIIIITNIIIVNACVVNYLDETDFKGKSGITKYGQ